MQFIPYLVLFPPIRCQYLEQYATNPQNIVFPLMCENMIPTHTKQQANYSFLYFNYYVYKQQAGRARMMNKIVVTIFRTQGFLVQAMKAYWGSSSIAPLILKQR